MNEYDAAAIAIAVLGCVLLVLGLSKRPQSLHMRIAKLALAVCCLVGGKLHSMQESLAAGFANEAEFLAAQETQGFIKIASSKLSRRHYPRVCSRIWPNSVSPDASAFGS